MHYELERMGYQKMEEEYRKRTGKMKTDINCSLGRMWATPGPGKKPEASSLPTPYSPRPCPRYLNPIDPFLLQFRLKRLLWTNFGINRHL